MKKILIILGLGIVFVIFAALLSVKVYIECRSQYGDCPASIAESLKAFNGKNIFSAKAGIKKQLGNNYLISDYSLQFKIPNVIRINLLVIKPAFALKIASGSQVALTGKDGRVLSYEHGSALPTVSLSSGVLPEVGQNVGDKSLFALNLATGVSQIYQIVSAVVQDESLHVELSGQIRVIFPLDGDIQVLLGSLRLIYSKIQNDGNPNNFTQIDLRFKNPVLR